MGGASGGGRTRGRGPADRDQGGDGGRSQGRDRRDPEHSRTWATALMMAHGGADGERSYGGGMASDSKGSTNGGGGAEMESQWARRMPRIRGARVEPRALATKAEADSRRLHHTDGGLRVSRGAARRQRWRRQERVGGWAFVSLRAFRDTLRIGSLQICLPINQIPWRSSSPSCIISSPSAAVQGAELHSRLTPSMACSLVVGTVAGSRTWSESNFRGSVARPSAGSQIWPESTPRRQQNPLEDHLRTRVLCIEWAERVVQVAGGVS